MTDLTPLLASAPIPLLGGICIGLAASLLYATTGRIGGVSGIAAGVLEAKRHDLGWRVAFLFGLLVAGTILLGSDGLRLDAAAPANGSPVPLWIAIPAGILVGFGARLGSGCTSGHGVCGISRLSVRSMVATVTFITTGAITVFALRSMGVLT